VALFENVRLPMSWYFPIAIASVAEARISIRRIEVLIPNSSVLDHLINSSKLYYHIQIQNFLLLDEVTNIPDNASSDTTKPTFAEYRVDFENVSAKWPVNSTEIIDNDEDNQISDISFSVGPGKILTIVGQVGSGKV